MITPELIGELIAEGMVQAEKVACTPGDSCCFAFPNPLDIARASCAPKGRCRIG